MPTRCTSSSVQFPKIKKFPLFFSRGRSKKETRTSGVKIHRCEERKKKAHLLRTAMKKKMKKIKKPEMTHEISKKKVYRLHIH